MNGHRFNNVGYCMYCHNVHRTDLNLPSICFIDKQTEQPTQMSTPILTKIAGIPHRKPNMALFIPGESVILEPEPTNAYDPNAIMVLLPLADGKRLHVGYIPRTDTAMCKGLPSLFIKSVDGPKWSEVELANYK